MLKLLRRVEFPHDLQTSGSVIKSTFLRHVSDYQSIVQQAQIDAEQILQEARFEAKSIRDSARQEALNELKRELESIRKVIYAQTEEFKNRTVSVCVEICSTVLERMIGSSDEKARMKVLIESLLERIHSARELKLRAHPGQLDLVKSTLVGVLGEQLNHRKCTVEDDKELQLFELNITTANGAQIIVSIENLLLIYKDEIESLRPDIQQALENIGKGHEVSS